MIEHRHIRWREWRWVVVASLAVVAASSVPYLVAWSRESPERVFSGCILLVEDCYSYLAKMRQGADGTWLFHIPYVPEEHPGTLFYLFYLLLGKTASLLPWGDLTSKLVLVYHLARVIFGFGLLVTVYRFLAALTRSTSIRRLAWLMVAVGGGFGWLLAGLGKARWLGSPPLDLFLAEGFAFLALYGFPHVLAAQSLLLGSLLCLLKAWGVTSTPGKQRSRDPELNTEQQIKDIPDDHHAAQPAAPATPALSLPWAALTGLLWLAMGLIIPFYVAVAWAVAGTALVTRWLRRRPDPVILLREALIAGLAGLISAPVIIYSAWMFTRDPVYATWAAQNRILSPHPFHYVAAYGLLLALAAFDVRGACDDDRGRAWLALAWVAVVPLLVYLPVNLQLRLLTGVQVPLSLLAARGAVKLWTTGSRWLTLLLLPPIIATSLFLLITSSIWMTSRPFPSFRDSGEVAVLDWLSVRAQPDDVVLTAYDTGAYLPARVHARTLTGHDLEAVYAEEKKERIDRFFDPAADDAWRKQFLTNYRVDYVFWGPAERDLGDFDPDKVGYLSEVYQAGQYSLFTVER